MTRPLMLSFMLALVLTACTTNPPENQVKLEGTPAQSKLQFVDLQQFDSDLAHSLSKEMPTVEIDFYGKVTPNNLPERLRPWMASLEANGGTVRLASTESTVTTRSPLLLIGVLSSLWSAAKMGADIKSKLDYKKTKGYNATIYIKTAPDGEVVVEKVLLTQQPPVKVP
ncbi:hypothetical protein [Curvibacter gracilis]|uniref:hypothetical protein n=1 Tax=Curvibacter gracilis TaxID=230310 RepID=UPI0012FB10B7|nr:hypothetical protein [Curvibacter gracilis]